MHKWLCVFLMVSPVKSFADSLVVRPLDHSAAATLTRALACSALVRALVSELDTTTAIVHVEVSQTLPSGIAGATRFVVSRGGHNYLRVSVSATLRLDLRAIMLGHELQHALEIARSGATSHAAVKRLVETTGYRTGPHLYETELALRSERRIRTELRQSVTHEREATLKAEPVIELHHHHLGAGRAKTATEVPKR